MEDVAATARTARAQIKAVDADAGRRRREEKAVALRKERRQDSAAKKRSGVAAQAEEEEPTPVAAAGGGGAGAAAAAASAVPTEVALAHLAAYVAAAMSDDETLQLQGVRQIRRLLSVEVNPPVEAVIASGMLERLVAFLWAPDDNATLCKVAFEAAWCLTNAASTSATATVAAVEGILPALVKNLVSGSAERREQAAWAIGNIAGDSAALRDFVTATPDAVGNLLLNVQYPEGMRQLATYTWCLSNLCRNKPAPAREVADGLLPAIAYLVCNVEDKEVLSDALWAATYLSEGSEALVDAVVAAGILPAVVKALGHSELSVSLPALRCIGNVASGTAPQTQAAVEAGIMPALVPLLTSGRRNVRREAAWTASNLAAGTKEQQTGVVTTPGLLDAVLAGARNADYATRKECIWVLCNLAVAGHPEHVCRMMAAHAVEPLTDMLAQDDVRMLCVVLDAVAAILAVEKRFVEEGNPAAAMCRFAEAFEEAGLVVRLEELQEHTADDVYSKARRIVDAHYCDGAAAQSAAENDAAPPAAAAALPPPPPAAFGGMSAFSNRAAFATPSKAAGVAIAAAGAFAGTAAPLHFGGMAFA